MLCGWMNPIRPYGGRSARAAQAGQQCGRARGMLPSPPNVQHRRLPQAGAHQQQQQQQQQQCRQGAECGRAAGTGALLARRALLRCTVAATASAVAAAAGATLPEPAAAAPAGPNSAVLEDLKRLQKQQRMFGAEEPRAALAQRFEVRMAHNLGARRAQQQRHAWQAPPPSHFLARPRHRAAPLPPPSSQAVQAQLQRCELLVKINQYDNARMQLREGAFSKLRLDLGYGQEMYRLVSEKVRRGAGGWVGVGGWWGGWTGKGIQGVGLTTPWTTSAACRMAPATDATASRHSPQLFGLLRAGGA